ncbi:winged helix-turn-helix domain-containing protein [Sulfuracidifex metallicus]|uniref:DNA-binding protein n=1 Tax=Sulfuracidifex metallicus DSM 6482 = JCM 9184 TaxID=523847 RepID=A0A6A9QNX4_SULME|nr:winged helix-turn-helix domain-containing protein [Sulfuracidifex metallicus]MUN28985.1 DNA-binding protein [Sulfuracidifex metallicus DSM 6482 = JCM 9184]WOE50508.1 winged helix-turn-helix domain-containing protein [Sulfuracidifex metallicus DSM 6482 = JCM 9184]
MKRRTRRNKIAIIRSILSSATNEIQKTALMYAVNLNHKTISYYLNELIKRGLISETANKGFQTTEKGKLLAKRIEEYEKHLEEAEKIKKSVLEVFDNKSKRNSKAVTEMGLH